MSNANQDKCDNTPISRRFQLLGMCLWIFGGARASRPPNGADSHQMAGKMPETRVVRFPFQKMPIRGFCVRALTDLASTIHIFVIKYTCEVRSTGLNTGRALFVVRTPGGVKRSKAVRRDGKLVENSKVESEGG